MLTNAPRIPQPDAYASRFYPNALLQCMHTARGIALLAGDSL